MSYRYVCAVLTLVAAPLSIQAQWLHYPDPSTPRTHDGKPNLTARAPRVHGKPDLSGIWEVEGSPRKQLEPYLLPGGINGLGEDDVNLHFLNVFHEYGFGKEPFQPAGAARYQKASAEKPGTLCAPPSLPLADLLPAPFKIVQTPRLTMVLYEGDTFFRQIYTDGRKLPENPQPAWLGYSVGHWESDTFVVEVAGFNDKGPLDAMGHIHSESMRVTERFHRRDFGHMELEVTVTDLATYTKPVTFKVDEVLQPDTDLIESFCSEGEQDLTHIAGQ